MSETPPDPRTPADVLPRWAALPNLSDRCNDLMSQNWALLSRVSELFDMSRPTGEWTTDDVEEAADLLAESLDSDAKFKAARTAEFEEWLHRQWGE